MTTPGARIDVVVPVYGGWPFVEECLSALEQQSAPVNVIVVDDASPDDTLSRVRARFSQFTIVANESNSGFSVSCNRGIRAGTAPLVVLLNSDVVVRPDFAERLTAALNAAPPRTGSIAPILLAADGTIDSFGITVDATAAGYVRYHGADADRFTTDSPAMIGPYGAAAAYRRTALDDVGLLDENIFMYGEELELALRLRAGGWSSQPLPIAVGTHIGGASAGKSSRRQLRLSSFGRGYTLRVYGVLRGRHAVRAVLAETFVVLVWLVSGGGLTALTGRVSGWRAARGVLRRRLAPDAYDAGIGFFQGLRMRMPDYWRSTP